MTTFELGTLIDTRPLSFLQVRTIALCALVVMLDGYDIQAMGLSVIAIARDWSISPASFSLALSASLVGIGVGSAFVAPLGDRWGRKPLILWSLLILGVGSGLTGLATSQADLILWRVVTGIGLGGTLTNTLALTTDLMPARKRSFLSILMISSIAVGAFFAGMLAPQIIARFDWPGIFYVGGIVPLGLLVLLYFGIPESPRFLYLHRPQHPGLAHIMARLAPGVDHRQVYCERMPAGARQSLATLLLPAYRRQTLLLWLIFCLNLFVMYAVISWLPALLSGAGWTQAAALRGAATLQVGSIVGGLIMGLFLDRDRTRESLFIAYGTAALALAAFLFLSPTPLAWGVLIFLVGCGINGTQLTLYALSAAIYPSGFRATGLGWAVAVSRLGAATGPLALGWLTALGWGTAAILGTLIVPTVLCALTVLAFTRALRAAPKPA